MQVTDPDLGDGQVIVFSILTGGVPYVVDVDTGVMTSAGLFRGLSGTRHEVQVEARDNKGDDPYLAANDTMVVSGHIIAWSLAYPALPKYVVQNPFPVYRIIC